MRLPDPLVVTPEQQLEQVSAWGVQRNFEAIQQRFPLGPDDLHFGGTVAALPTGIDEGFEVNYIADSTNGVLWRFKYLPSTSATYPWLFLGGPPLVARVDTTETTTSTSFVDLATVGPSVTVPLAGVYDARGQAALYATATSIGLGALKIGTAATNGNERLFQFDSDSTGTRLGALSSGDLRFTASAANTACTVQYRGTTDATWTFAFRKLAITPVRVA